MTATEFSRRFSLNAIGTTHRTVSIAAEAEERSALAARFAFIAINRLEATATLTHDGDTIVCTAMLSADVVQECVATAAPVTTSLKTDFIIRFVPDLNATSHGDEIEIDIDDCDFIEHDGHAIDLGEAVAQTLLLSLDPFPRAAHAGETLKAAGIVSEDDVENTAFSGLKSLLGKP